MTASLTFVTTVYLGRVLAPEAFGIFSWGLALLSYFFVLPNLGLPPWTLDAFLWLSYAGFLGYLLMSVSLARAGKPLPTVSHVVVGSHLLWFSISGWDNFYNMVPFFHCLQYLVIVAYFHFRERRAVDPELNTGGFVRSGWFVRYYLFLILLGWAMFEALPVGLEQVGLTTYTLAAATVTAFINLHHFILDAYIWKLRKPEVSNLLVHNADPAARQQRSA